MSRLFSRLVGTLAALLLSWSPIMAEDTQTQYAAALARMDKSHPRLIVTEADLAALKQLVAKDEAARKCYEGVLKRADDICRKPALVYKKVGPRLLSVSRDCVERIYALGLAWRLTGKDAYAAKAEEELLAVSAFPDWNPSHFLDTAEMSHAVGLGYDWFFSSLSPETRGRVRAALIEKGMKPGLAAYTSKTPAWWVKSEFNWNQVCNSGLLIGALAIAETDPEYARAFLPVAIPSMRIALASYGPDGAWGEGPGYWGYATRYTVYGLAALDSTLGTDFGLSETKGLDRAGWFPIYTTGPTGLYLNFADAGENSRRGNLPDLFWLARRFKTPEFADAERPMMEKRPGDPRDLIWYRPAETKGKPLALDKVFGGRVEVAVFRSAWDDPDALFLGVKAGYNQVNHGHLDLGNFEMDALGVRWARDIGSDDYNLPDYFSGGPNAKRWTYYRLNSHSHNVPMLNDRDQDTRATARLIAFRSTPAFAGVTIDLTSAYKDLATKATRGVAMLDRRRVLVQDEFELAAQAEVAWGMTTDAEVAVAGSRATLTQKGKELRAEVLSPAGAQFSVESAEQPPPQAANKGVKRLMLRLKDQKGSVRVAVLLTPVWPDGKEDAALKLKALTEW